MVDMLTGQLDDGSCAIAGGVRHHLSVSELSLTRPRGHVTIIIHLHVISWREVGLWGLGPRRRGLDHPHQRARCTISVLRRQILCTDAALLLMKAAHLSENS